MNPVHPMTFDVVKVEQERQQAHRQRQSEAMHQTQAHDDKVTTRRVPAGDLRRRLAAATATAVLLLSLIAGAAFALQAPADGGPAGGPNGAAAGGGGGINLLR